MSNGTSLCADGGRFGTGSLFAPGEYSRRSDQAHLVISLSLCTSTLAYLLHSMALLTVDQFCVGS
jgi:hypothetical protein